MPGAYYNEIDSYAAQWLRNLIAAGHIAPGEVDERSIVDVHPDDLRGFTQCHFFAGIGGWSLAARLAGWPDERPLWTGSCPCQPFSAAGKRKGTADDRHLWPEFYRLIRECRPAVVAGEQVASKDGRLWLAGVRADLEALGYSVGAADLCAAGIGAPHIRQRLWWLANADERAGRQGCAIDRGRHPGSDALEGAGLSGGGLSLRMVHPKQSGLEGYPGYGHNSGQSRWIDPGSPRPAAEAGGPGAWSRYALAECRDVKRRRFEPGSFPLAHGVSNRVGRLRAYGNAIVPQLAAEVLGAYLDGAQ